MRTITLTLVVHFYIVVEIHAQLVGAPLTKHVALDIAESYDNLRPLRPLKPTTENHTNHEEDSNSSITNPDTEKTIILPTLYPSANSSTGKPVETNGSLNLTASTEGVTISPTIHPSAISLTDTIVDTNRSKGAVASIFSAIHTSVNLPSDEPATTSESTTAKTESKTVTELSTTDLSGGKHEDETDSPTSLPTYHELEFENYAYYDSDELSDQMYDAIGVDVALQIQSIADVDEEDQKIIIDADLLVHWKDYQLFNESEPTNKKENLTELLMTYGAKQLSDKLFGPIWKPDIFIERVVKISKPRLMSRPYNVRYIKESSSIIFKSRASVKVDCSMDFRYYPADTQHCILDLRSYQDDKTKMELRWNPLPGAFLVNPDTNDNFDLKLSYVAQRKERTRGIILKSQVYDVLQIKLSMRRRLTYHILQTYLPSAFLVIITWLSFLIPEDLIEGRIGISLTTLLTLTAMFSSVRENTPVVSYVRAIDIWMAFCIFTVFSTLLEFTFFVWLRNYKIGKGTKKLENAMLQLKDGGKDSVKSKIERQNSSESGIMRQMSITEIPTMAAEAFERTARIFNHFALAIFVFSFVAFNVSYWTWLLGSSHHARWDVNKTLNGGHGDIFGFFGDKDCGYDDSNLANHELLAASNLPVT